MMTCTYGEPVLITESSSVTWTLLSASVIATHLRWVTVHVLSENPFPCLSQDFQPEPSTECIDVRGKFLLLFFVSCDWVVKQFQQNSAYISRYESGQREHLHSVHALFDISVWACLFASGTIVKRCNCVNILSTNVCLGPFGCWEFNSLNVSAVWICYVVCTKMLCRMYEYARSYVEKRAHGGRTVVNKWIFQRTMSCV